MTSAPAASAALTRARLMGTFATAVTTEPVDVVATEVRTVPVCAAAAC